MRYKALLIGASNYGIPGVEPLPFVPDDLERMADAFVRCGFHQANVAQFPYATPNEINGEVTRFLGAAERGDRLVVVLSGHGVHYNGRDYLVPEDIQPELFTFAKGCVEIDWGEELEESRAEQVVFLIDACREGIQRDTKAGTAAWSNRKAAAALRRKVAYVYACSQGQYARFVRPKDAPRPGQEVGTGPGESFSLFSRAVSDLLGGQAEHPGGLSALGDFRIAVQQRVDALHTAYGKADPVQRVRVRTEQDESDFTIVPPAERPSSRLGTAERTWTERVTNHLSWKLTAPEQAETVGELKEACRRLVGELARSCATAEDDFADDPWYDRTLAERTTERVGFLLQRMEDTALSPTEAALLAVLPFAAQAHWAGQASRRGFPEAEVIAFLQLFPRLNRRLRNLRKSQADALRDIHWWGYHRWLAQLPETYAIGGTSAAVGEGGQDAAGSGRETWAADLPSSYGWIRAELSAPRLLRYLREQRIAPAAAPGTTRSTELVEEHEVAPSTAHEHTVRERLVSALLKAAHALAIDAADLPEVLVEHLGISDSVSLDALHTTIRASHWQASGTGRSLGALCHHPAVHVALTQHVESVDALLRDINHVSAAKGSSLAPLSALPAYANAQHVKPSPATPVNLSSGIRFRLADDRVQELLMGEQLYGDRALAVRELYQNGLDALRYRAARTAYLRRTGARLPEWQGEIAFRQGTDERGRPYLECEDNGIGMGVTELSRSFSTGGARFVDLPEYLEEGVLWGALDPPVELHPVSRFGLGVLSYFMIADELAVWTCRLDREGRPGRLLKVTIAGPGNLFRVEDVGRGREAGTRVRLISTPERGVPSSVEGLKEYLWVSPFRVTATDREGAAWVREPEVLAVEPRPQPSSTELPSVVGKPLGERRITRERTPYMLSSYLTEDPAVPSRQLNDGPENSSPPLRFPGAAVAAPRHEVWWTSGHGSVLVDGLAADQPLFGRAVDLHGSEQASLSVDRKKILSYDRNLVHEHCMAALDELVEQPEIVSPSWLCRLHQDDPVLAEAATARATAARVVWTVGDQRLDAGRAGLFPPDLLLLPTVTGRFTEPATHHDDVAALLILGLPEPVVRWRLRALLGLPSEPGEPAALLSDMTLLSANSAYGISDWEELAQQADEVFRQEDRHGYFDSVKVWSTLEKKQLQTQTMAANAATSLFPWRPAHRPVTTDEIISAAHHLRVPVQDVARRLRAIGYQVVPLGDEPVLTAEDMALTNLRLPSLPAPPRRPSLHLPLLGSRFRPSERPARLERGLVPLAHLLCQEDPAAAARRLRELSYRVPDGADALLAGWPQSTPGMRELGQSLMLHPDALPTEAGSLAAITKAQLLCVAARMGREPADLAGELAHLGFTVPGDLTSGSSIAAQRRAALSGLTNRRSRVIPYQEIQNAGLQYYSYGYERINRPSVRSALLDLGFKIAEGNPDHHLADLDDYTAEATLTPTGIRIVAGLTGASRRTVRAALKKAGLGDLPTDDGPANEQFLLRHLKGETSTLRRPAKGHPIRLTEIASAALLTHRPFAEAAAAATELGFRHEAEDWFGDQDRLREPSTMHP